MSREEQAGVESRT